MSSAARAFRSSMSGGAVKVNDSGRIECLAPLLAKSLRNAITRGTYSSRAAARRYISRRRGANEPPAWQPVAEAPRVLEPPTSREAPTEVEAPTPTAEAPTPDTKRPVGVPISPQSTGMAYPLNPLQNVTTTVGTATLGMMDLASPLPRMPLPRLLQRATCDQCVY